MSIQLIKKDDHTGLLSLNDEGLNLIKQLNNDISMCLILGPKQQGKSFLMNRLIHNEKKTFDNVTKGVWINRDPIKINKDGKEFNIIFADTEGLELDEAWEIKLFMLSISICSMLIYNTTNALTDEAFKNLSFMTHLTDKIKLKSGIEDYCNKINLRHDCPSFVWVIRDYSLEHKMIPNVKLINFLKTECNGDKTEIETRNEIRVSMINLFKSFDCFYLSIPECDESLSGKFRDEFERIRDHVYSSISPKVINNQSMNGQVFCEFIKQVVKFINSNEVINLQDTLMDIVEIFGENVFTQAKTKYVTQIEELFSKSESFNQQELMSLEKSIAETIIDSIRIDIGENQSVSDKIIEKFQNFRF